MSKFIVVNIRSGKVVKHLEAQNLIDAKVEAASAGYFGLPGASHGIYCATSMEPLR